MDEVRAGIALVLLVAAMASDLRSRLIPDWVAVGLVLLFLVPAVVHGQWHAIAANTAVAACVFILGAVAFHFGWVGGGDVKLSAALAFWAGPAGVASFLLLTSLAGGAVCLACLGWEAVAAWRRGGMFTTSSVRVPYGVAIVLGGVPWVLAAAR